MGLQVDGDLWEQAWKAVLKRGAGNQTLRKVKGHATELDVAEGRATQEDRDGNDKSDKLADKGVEEIAGQGLVKLGSWCETRWKRCRKLVNRIHKMIVGVTQAEKAERAKQLTIFKATQGYDPEKWVKTRPRIRDESNLDPDYNHIELVPHTTGKHRFAHCQTRYEQIHNFLGNRKWAQVSEDSHVSGITWIELFVLFDIAGGRTDEGQYHKNLHATMRAKKRRQISRRTKKHKGSIDDVTSVTKATLDEEIKDFKMIVRHIFKHEVKLAKGKWIRMENRTHLRRLNDLGIFGHQPAIKAYCQMSPEEKTTIMGHILKQKVANNRKVESTFAEHREKGKEKGRQHARRRLWGRCR